MAVRDFIGDLKSCHECGKTINVTNCDDWVYQRKIAGKKRRVFFCSWTCLRKYDAEQVAKKKAKKEQAAKKK